MIQILFLVLVFVGAMLAAVAVGSILWPDAAKQRLQQLQPGEAAVSAPDLDPKDWKGTVIAWAKALAAQFVSEGASGTETKKVVDLRQKLLHAGIRDHDAPQAFLGIKLILVVMLPVVALLVMLLADASFGLSNLLVMACLAALGWMVPDAVLRSMIERRQQEIFENFPDLLDLVIVCVEAGLGTEAAMMRVTDEMRTRSSVLAEELRLMNLELKAGVSRIDAFRHLAERTGVEDILAFVNMMSQSERFGTSIVTALRQESDSLRTRRRQRVEEAAAKMPVKLIMPMAFCILPSLLLVILGPAVVQMIRQLSQVMVSQ